ncbi:hypothetical protein ABL78_8099 [Leptomonas seymouri]|uniref:DNA repair protein Rad9 n=1 Tax=Leptomonas seymouri TaxID=5684 RepID=A0A0N1I126_LEPSE|nr:hypothetical protein ABL78_8099 [Leptomonas seymouri]|eukprot:KPI82885.1 hypothetical protein ABL78_8099 [Leptomonas seymouri]
MSLHFTVSGGNIRTFLSVLLCVGKIGEAVYFVALADGIELSAVTPSRNGHIAVRLHERCFDNFTFDPPKHSNAAGLAAEGGEGGAPDNLSLCVLAKTLMATALRQHNNNSLQSIEFSYDIAESMSDKNTAEAATDDVCQDVAAVQHEKRDKSNRHQTDFDERSDADMVRWKCTYARSITKTFLLRLAEGVPTSVCADAARYHFEVCGEARTYGSLLASLPSGTVQCGLTLLESGGLELRSVSNAQQQPTASSARGKAASSMAAPSADGSATVVTAFAKAFHVFRFFDVVRASVADAPSPDRVHAAAVSEPQQQAHHRGADDLDASSGPSAVLPTPSPNTQQPQQQQSDVESRNVASNAAAAAAAGQPIPKPFVQLPGKVFDVKPFKQAAWLAEQLGVQLRLRCGEAGMPLILGSITPEEVQLIAGETAAGQLQRNSGRGHMQTSNSNDDIAYGSGVASPPTFNRLVRSAADTAVPACISFTVHVAALDMASSVTGAGAAGGGREMNIATAMSSAVNTPRASAHYSDQMPSVAAQPAQRHSGVGGGNPDFDGSRGKTVTDGFVSSLPPPPSADHSQLASATRSSMNLAPGNDGGGGGGSITAGGGPRSSLGLTSTASMVQPTPQNDGQPFSNSPNCHTPSHVDASCTSTAPSSVHGGRAGEPLGEERSTCLYAPPAADSYYATPRPSIAHTPNVVVVMTSGDTPESGGCQDNAGGLAAMPPLVAPTAPLSYAAASLNALYPLDFETFARSYTTQNDVEGEEDDAQDAELREFLASCVASMSRGLTQS